MEVWFLLVVSVCLAALLKAIINVAVSPATPNSDSDDSRQLPLPPEAHSSFPIISGILLLRKTLLEVEESLKSLRLKLGPIVTLHLTSRPAIFIFSRSIAHKALIENGAVFADRPDPLLTGKILTNNQHNINSAGYGEKWRILRRNLTSNILHPSRIKSFSPARSWMLRNLIQRLHAAESPVDVIEHLRFSMFCLLCFMCFGDRLNEDQIREIEAVHHRFLLVAARLSILNVRPWFTKLVFRNRWRELFDVKKSQNDVVIPLIRARRQLSQNDAVPAYVDSLLDLELPEEDENGGGGVIKRKMEEEEIVSACSEFLGAGTDTTSTALQWIMANLVKSQRIQNKLFDEILEIVGPEAGEIREEDLEKMEYLKLVVMEGLRRHPPGHFLLPHAVTREVELEGYRIPNDAVLNFMAAEMGWDPEVWEDPLEFNPERFVGVDVDITGSREIKMMPFGAGRRICPGLGLAMLHVEYFVANLVWEFEWREDGDYPVDFAEKQEFTVVMKHPLRARITTRSHRRVE